MSWQSYVDTLMATKAMTSCGIFGLDGSTWAASAGFPISAEHTKLIAAATSDSSKVAAGVTVGAERYILVRSDPGVSVILKKGPNGIVACKSTQCVIIAIHDQSVKTERAITEVGKIVDYLSKHGY